MHRDLKPENILILPDGHIKLLDFGIALDEASRRLTWFGLSSTVGTPDYMAPEQVGGRRGDVRTDIYATGTMLYEMLTGELPYSGANAQSLMRSKQNDDPAPTATARLQHQTPKSKRSSCTPSSGRRATATKRAKTMLEELRDPVDRSSRAAKISGRAGRCVFIPRKKILLGALVAVVALLILLTMMSSKKAKHPAPSRPSYRSEVQ